MGMLQKAGARRRGAGKGAPGVAEKLRLEKICGDRGHVDRCKRILRPDTGRVDGPGEQLLARATLAGNENGHIAGRVQLGLFDDAVHGLRLGDDRFEGDRIEQFGMGLSLFQIQYVQQALAFQCPGQG